MTPFMLQVRATLEGRSHPPPQTEPSRAATVASAAHAQVQLRSLAEQLVAEANSVLRGRAPTITLVDVPDPGGLVFTLTCGERSARVETAVSGRDALARVTTPGLRDAQPRRLTDAQQVESLVLALIPGQRHVPAN